MTIPEISLIAENVPDTKKTDTFDRSLDMTDSSYLKAVANAFSKQGIRYRHFSTPDSFAHFMPSDTLVFSLWSGAKNPNRLLFVPNICEMHNIPYFGPDAISRSMCVNKFVAKHIAKRHGFFCPNSVLIYSSEDIDSTIALRPPVIVKPAAEGSRVGIRPSSVSHDQNALHRNIRELFAANFSPVLLEEFVPGSEAVIYVLGTRASQIHTSHISYPEEDPSRFTHQPNLPTLVSEGETITTEPLPSTCAEKVQSAALSLFQSFSKMHLLGINGRVDSLGNFWFVEMNGFPSVKPGTASEKLFTRRGFDYSQAMKALVLLALSEDQPLEPDEQEMLDDLFERPEDRSKED